MKFISTLLALSVLLAAWVGVVSCGPDGPEPTPAGPTIPTDPSSPTEVDKTAPAITVKVAEIDVTGGMLLTYGNGSMSIGETLVAEWSDDKTATDKLKVEVALEGRSISSGSTVNESGKLTISITDEVGNKSSNDIQITVDSSAPVVSALVQEVNVFGGYVLTVMDGGLSIGEKEIFTWTDEKTTSDKLNVEVEFNGSTLQSGATLAEAGALTVTVTDEGGNSSTASVNVICAAVLGLERFSNLTLQVGQEVDLLEGLTFADGVTLQKVEALIDGEMSSIDNPEACRFEIPGSLVLKFFIQDRNGKEYEITIGENDGYRLIVSPLDIAGSDFGIETMEDLTWYNPETGTDW